MAVEVKEYTFFCLEMFSNVKYPCVKTLDEFYISNSIAQYDVALEFTLILLSCM